MNIALFGGTFDPIHAGHMQAARAAARKYRLDRILFVPTGSPPHKVRDRLTPFPHRYAMVCLACASDPRFVPSLLEVPTPDGRPRYSIDTVRTAKDHLRRGDKLYFLIGADAFLDLPHWNDYRRLLGLVNFIVVSRPGFDSAAIRNVVPREMVRTHDGSATPGTLHLHHTTVQILRGINAPVASRDIREAICNARRVTGLVPPLVEQYILKEELYRPRSIGAHRK